jgi:hypothetical protein
MFSNIPGVNTKCHYFIGVFCKNISDCLSEAIILNVPFKEMTFSNSREF